MRAWGPDCGQCFGVRAQGAAWGGSEDYSKWYLDVIDAADLIDESPVRASPRALQGHPLCLSTLPLAGALLDLVPNWQHTHASCATGTVV